MKDNKLIASLVVFKELYDNNKDIYEIISEFIKASAISQQRWSFNAGSISRVVDEEFNFNIPVAVIKSAIKKHLVPNNFVKPLKGEYVVNDIKSEIDNEFVEHYQQKQNLYDSAIQDIISYIEEKKETKITEEEILQIKENIIQYLLGNEDEGSYTNDISYFIVIKKNDQDFINNINLIKQGLILYTGIKYTSDLDALGYWKSDLTIFLDTNIIFNLVGFSGKIHANIYNDFSKLVNEINEISNTDKIKLRFFEETEKEINDFFNAAISIFESPNKAYPYATAMKSIINGCKSKSDIQLKRVKLFSELEKNKIYKEDEINYYENFDYVVEGEKVVEEIKELTNSRDIIEEKIQKCLKLFTKINVLREGVSNMGFDKCKYILLTSSGLVNFLAFCKPVKQYSRDIPFATSLDFLTDKFWFKLNKGFSNKSNLPLSFDFVTKAQVILSAHIDHTIEAKFEDYQKLVKRGEITMEEIREMSFQLRDLTIQPDYLNENTVDKALASIDEYSYDNYVRIKEETNTSLKKGEDAINELASRDRVYRSTKTKSIKSVYKIAAHSIYFIITISILGFIYLSYYIFISLIEETDSKLSILSLVLGLLAPAVGIWKYGKIINDKIRKAFINRFKTKLLRIINPNG